MSNKYCNFCNQNNIRLYKFRYSKRQGFVWACTNCRRKFGIRVLQQFIDKVHLSKVETNFEKHKKSLSKENFLNMVRGNGDNVADFFYTRNSRFAGRELTKFLRNSCSVEAEFQGRNLNGS